MYKVLASWFFGLGILADIGLVLLKCLGLLDWSWGIIIAIPFALAIVGTIGYAIIYGIIKFVVTLIMIN